MEIAAANGSELVSRKNPIVVIARVGGHTDANLAKIADAIHLFGLFFRPRNGRQHHRREDCYNGNYDEEFNQSETCVSLRRICFLHKNFKGNEALIHETNRWRQTHGIQMLKNRFWVFL